MHRNAVLLSSRQTSTFKTIFFGLICLLVLQTPSFGQCNAGLFINEFHYDNIGTDNNEFVEVAVPNMVIINLSEYVVSLYNGGTGMVYDAQSLDNFQVGMTDMNYTYYVWKPSSIQQGPDGIALSRVSQLNIQNCEFLSYEGTFMAVDGPAMGTTSTDVGVAESNTTTPDTYSLQLIGNVWQGPIPSTPGNTNVNLGTPDALLISEVEICDQLIEIQNIGIKNVDISTWMLCNFPAYAMISSTNIISGSLLLAPGDFVTIQWNDLSPTAGELGLYLPGTAGQNFGDPDNIIDYVQYNSINNTRAPVAVAAGVWDDAAIGIPISACVSSIANATNPLASNSTTWCDAAMQTIIPPGANSACAPPPVCGVSFPDPADFTCQGSTFGIDNVTVELKYVGMDAGAVLSITVNGSMVSNNGDDPSSDMDGTISFTAQEGDSYVITFTDALCSSVSSSGTIPDDFCPGAAICPNVGDLIITEIMYNPSGTEPASEWFEVCNITNTAIDMNGFDIADAVASHTIGASVIVPANGCIVISHTDMLVCGGAMSAYQHGAFSLNQGGDQVEISCGGIVVDVVAYDGGGTFPSEGNGEAISFNSSVSQDHITNDDGANWCIATTSCGADDLATPGVANPACVQTCGITFIGNPTYICVDNTVGVDMVKVNVSYGGVDAGAMLVIMVNGNLEPNVGDDPSQVANGTISFGAQEGDMISLTFTDALCDPLSLPPFMVPTNQCPGPSLCTAGLYINGVIDGDLPGGTPKAMQLCATTDISDLSIYGIESVTNGSGSAGIPEYNFPPDPLGGGDCIWLSVEAPSFISFFGFAPCYIDGVVNVNGDDALLLYCGPQVLDALGDPNCDPNSSLPDCGIWEYMDGWVFANDMVPNPIFDDSEWVYSMENALDGEFNNATAVRPYPNPGTGCPICPDDFANGGLPHSQAPLTFILDTNADLEADGDIISDQVIGSLDPDVVVDYDSGTSILLDSNFEVYPGVTFHAFIDGCGGI